MKLERILLVGLFCLILSASPAVGATSHPPQPGHDGGTPLNLGLGGVITNAGDQQYKLRGGQLVSGMINNDPVTSDYVSFQLQAYVHGLSVEGQGSLNLPTGFKAQIMIDDVIPAAVFPLNPDGSSCDPLTQTCNSEIPLFFTGSAFINTGRGDSEHAQVEIESAYWDPLGGAIVISSMGPGEITFSFVVKYTTATISWLGVQLQGVFGGYLGTEPVSGAYNQVTYSQENLLTGTESDFGSIAFVYATDPTLNGEGFFFGHTTFNTVDSFDCAPLFGFPILEGYCLATGATSDGSFFMAGGQGAFIVGVYETIWSVPSITTATTVMASVF